MEVGPSAPPMMAMAAATADGKPSASASRNAEKMPSCAAAPSSSEDWAGDQRTEISHRADAEKDDGRIDRVLYALIEDPEHAGARAVDRRVQQTGERKVGEQHAECDRNEQQRLKSFADAEIQQHERNQDHDQAARIFEKRREAGICQNAAERTEKRKLHIERLPLHRAERCAGSNACALLHADRADRAGAGRTDLILHFHRLEDE